jgi:hypothetical protein
VKKILMLAIVLGLLMIGCASKTLNVRTPPADFSTSCQVLKDVEATGWGLLLWGVIPIGSNDRFDNAYQEALGSAGATHLIDVKLVDHWYYIPYVGMLLSVRIEGKAIQCQGFAPVERKKKEESTAPPASGDTGWGGK